VAYNHEILSNKSHCCTVRVITTRRLHKSQCVLPRGLSQILQDFPDWSEFESFERVSLATALRGWNWESHIVSIHDTGESCTI